MGGLGVYIGVQLDFAHLGGRKGRAGMVGRITTNPAHCN